MLERVFGKEEAGRMISRANQKKKVNETGDNIEYDDNIVEGLKKSVSAKYGKVIEQYRFPTDLIEAVCIRRVFH